LISIFSTSSSPKNVRDKSAASFLNQGDYNRRTPLILAAEGGMDILRIRTTDQVSKGHIELVKFLVEHGADVHATDR
jgi:ankyrin repeat protein